MEQKNKKQLYIKLSLVVIIIFAFVYMFSGTSEQSSSQPVTQKTFVSRGENGYIDVFSSTTIIAVTENDFEELTNSYFVGDTDGVVELLMSNRAFSVNNGIKVLVIDRKVASSKVRILEGEQTGRSGWIMVEWISKTK